VKAILVHAGNAAPAVRAVMQRRMLVNYRVDSGVLAALLPAPFRPTGTASRAFA
jgi:hypothetical protein